MCCGYVDEAELIAWTASTFRRYMNPNGCIPADKVVEAAEEVFSSHGGEVLPVSTQVHGIQRQPVCACWMVCALPIRPTTVAPW